VTGPGDPIRSSRPPDWRADQGLDHSDFSVVVKSRAPTPKPWRWEIYRAGRRSPIEHSAILFETATEANRAGKKALTRLLTEFPE